MSSDLPGVNPATLNGILLYYRLMTKKSGLGDSTELSQVGLSHSPKEDLVQGNVEHTPRLPKGINTNP
jgi:hypothetical protein